IELMKDECACFAWYRSDGGGYIAENSSSQFVCGDINWRLQLGKVVVVQRPCGCHCRKESLPVEGFNRSGPNQTRMTWPPIFAAATLRHGPPKDNLISLLGCTLAFSSIW